MYAAGGGGGGWDDYGCTHAGKKAARAEGLIVPLRVQVYDEPDGIRAAAWAAGCFVVLWWGKPLLNGVGPSCLRGCDYWSVER